MHDRVMHSATDIDRYPAPWRLVFAFAIAPLFGAVFLALLQAEESVSLARLVAFIRLLSVGAFSATAIFGLPAYFVLRRVMEPSLINCALVGALVAVAPGFLLELLPMSEHFQFSIGGHATVTDGSRTAWGWELWRASLIRTIVAGVVGGAVFWVLALSRVKAPKSA